MSQIKINKAIIESSATDLKPGYVLKLRILNSGLLTDARILELRHLPFSLTMDFEDDLTVEPAIDYSDIDAEFDPDREDDDGEYSDSED